MRDGLDEDLANALARLEATFRTLAETRDTVGHSLNRALTELTRRLDELDDVRVRPGTQTQLRFHPERDVA